MSLLETTVGYGGQRQSGGTHGDTDLLRMFPFCPSILQRLEFPHFPHFLYVFIRKSIIGYLLRRSFQSTASTNLYEKYLRLQLPPLLDSPFDILDYGCIFDLEPLSLRLWLCKSSPGSREGPR